MNNKKSFAWFTLFVLLLLSYPKAPQANGLDWSETLSFLREKFPRAYVHMGDVVETNGNRVVFNLKTGTTELPSRGSELMVTSHEPGVPVYLQKESGIIKVISILDDRVLAQGVASFKGSFEKGDSIVMPASPTVYLYTQIRDKESFLPYKNLLQGLIDEHLEVVETHDATISNNGGPYGVLLRLDAGNGYLATKIQSIYSGNTFYSGSVPLETAVALSNPDENKVNVNIPEKQAVAPMVLDGTVHPRKTQTLDGEGYLSLDGEYKRLVFADMDADGKQELILLKDQGIFGFKPVDGKYLAWKHFLFKGSDLLGIHLHCGDMDMDGKDELLVTLVEETEHLGKKDSILKSLILTFANDTLTILDEHLPFYLRTIQDRGGKVVFIGQAGGQYEPYAGPIFQIHYDKNQKKVVKGPLYKPAAEVFSLYQFNLDPFDEDRLLILEPNNDLYGYHASSEKIGTISPRNYGAYEEISYPVKLKKEVYSQGEFYGIGYKTVFAPRRFVLNKEHANLVFLINKERASNIARAAFNKFLGKSSAKDQILGIMWQGDRLIEPWKSEAMERDIIDFCFAGGYIHILGRNTNGNCFVSPIL
ncbi:hypothetical protein HRM2_15260 [Desulforapulum autotrophicum HRM2]|uniref:VCBS repeat-containing protein n=1 Tax=Desulforapulum autotrophicum (strain ATCC 43914 / DSM 3382 / VKM B-1955 / HRM2) TaxID=177437 RepID=C0Q9S1_DESAH|nr:VCBS repeat-containing protein [Desulforapulum autotrophicum]ACN14635.1 hypothetical protein HRM2_15260 [Desulforapulum autotrophicum HRM2]